MKESLSFALIQAAASLQSAPLFRPTPAEASSYCVCACVQKEEVMS